MQDFRIRSLLTISFSSFFISFSIIILLLTGFDHLSFDEAKEIFEIIAPILTGFLGSIFGYYFSTR